MCSWRRDNGNADADGNGGNGGNGGDGGVCRDNCFMNGKANKEKYLKKVLRRAM